MKPSIYIILWLCASACVTTKHSTTVVNNTTATKPKNNAQDEYNLFFKAEKARLAGENANAIIGYKLLTQTYNTNAIGYYNLARLQFQKLNFEEAETNAQKATLLQPANKFYRELYADILAYRDKHSEAALQYQKLAETNILDDEYLYKQSMLYLKAKEYDKAIEVLTKIEQKSGINEDVIIQKNAVYLKQGKIENAVLEMQKLIRLDPTDTKYYLAIADIYQANNLPQKAAKQYQFIEKEFPEEPKVLVALAQYYYDIKDTTKANELIKKVLRSNDIDAETKMALLIPSLQRLENDTTLRYTAEILQSIKEIVESNPENKNATILYADILYMTKKYDLALQQYQKYLKQDKSKFQVWVQVFSIFSEKQLYDSMITTANACIVYFPNNALPYFYQGIAYQQKKDFNQAVKVFNTAIDLEPENKNLFAQLYSSLGDVYNSTKNYTYSDSCFKKALKILPDDAGTLNNYAYYLTLRNEHLDDAALMSKRSLELQPQQKSFLDTYAWVLYKQKKYEDAKRYMLKALQVEGNNDATLYEHLGDIYYKLNDATKAMENWKIAQQKSENNPALNKKISDGKLDD